MDDFAITLLLFFLGMPEIVLVYWRIARERHRQQPAVLGMARTCLVRMRSRCAQVIGSSAMALRIQLRLSNPSWDGGKLTESAGQFSSQEIRRQQVTMQLAQALTRLAGMKAGCRGDLLMARFAPFDFAPGKLRPRLD